MSALAAPRKCPHTQLRLTLTAEEIGAHAKALVASLEDAWKAIEKGEGDALAVWTEATDAVAVAAAEACLPALVAGDADARLAGSRAKTVILDAFAEAYGRRGLYEALEKAPATGDAAARCKAKHLAFFEAKGLGIEDPVVREEVAALSREIGRQCANFERDINADTADVKLKRYELQGVPESLLDSLPSDDGGVTVKVSMKAPILTPVLQNAIDGKTRRKVYVASKKRVVPNCGRLNRVVQVRAGVAERLGKASHAAHQLERNVCATPEECKAFLDRAAARLKPIRDADLAALLAKKREEKPNAKKVHPWDMAYYGRQIRKEKGIDEEALKPHFPSSEVVPAAIRALGEDLFGFVVKGPLEDAALWHEDCELYAVEADGKPVGYVALDLRSRDGKFGHQMVVPLRPALPGGAPNVCAVLGNLGDSAGLLRFREVETLLHELGHVFHALAGSPKPSILGWAWPMVPWPGGVEMDFLEVPSMLTQQFVYAPEMLAKIARPHSETGAPLPRETIDALAANRHLLAGAGTARYLAMCRYDLAMHELSEDDATRLDMPTLWPPICLDVAGVEEPEDTHFASTWYHMAIGYDAGYYSYLWSEVCAVDAYAKFADRLDAKEGARLRDIILEPGAAASGQAMIEAFLGRPVSDDAYFSRLGV